MAESDWDTVTVLRKKGPTAAQAKSKQVPSQWGAAGSCWAARCAAVAGPSLGNPAVGGDPNGTDKGGDLVGQQVGTE